MGTRKQASEQISIPSSMSWAETNLRRAARLVDIFNFVVDLKRVWRSLRAAWNAEIPLPLSLLATATVCGLVLVGQWYFELLA